MAVAERQLTLGALPLHGRRSWLVTGGVLGIGSALTGYGLLTDDLQRASLLWTMRLSLEVTALCLALCAIPSFRAYRERSGSWGGRVLAWAALISLLIPTIARSLSFSALFAYYGPLSSLLRRLRLWPENSPLESSHAAVVVSLVTLYLPLSLLVLGEGARQLGRSPDIAATLGAGKRRRLTGVVLPGLARPAAAAALIIFSQTMGVIVTPRILGSRDITVAVLIDEMMNQQLNLSAAGTMALAELLVVLPMACAGALFLGSAPLKRLVPARGERIFDLGSVAVLLAAGLLVLPPVVLLLLSSNSSAVLSLLGRGAGFSPRWYAAVLGDAAWRNVVGTSLQVWGTSASASILIALLLAQFALSRPALRRGLRALALIVLFIPQNVLGVLLFSALARLPSTVVAGVPGWILGGLGQAIPAGGLAYLILDAALERVGRPVRLGAVLGASWRQRVQRIVVPLILPALVGCLMVSALVTLDDVIFVRYLPRSGLQTFSTELFSRARYTSSPELAAVCVLLWLVVAAVGLFIPVLGRLLTTPSAISDAVVDNAVAHGPGVASS